MVTPIHVEMHNLIVSYFIVGTYACNIKRDIHMKFKFEIFSLD
jgi:hypothetical protein